MKQTEKGSDEQGYDELKREREKLRKKEMKRNPEKRGPHLYFWWPCAWTSAWYLVLQVSRGYRMVVLTSAPTAPEVASDKDSMSTALSDSRSTTSFYTISNEWEIFLERSRGVERARAQTTSIRPSKDARRDRAIIKAHRVGVEFLCAFCTKPSSVHEMLAFMKWLGIGMQCKWPMKQKFTVVTGITVGQATKFGRKNWFCFFFSSSIITQWRKD